MRLLKTAAEKKTRYLARRREWSRVNRDKCSRKCARWRARNRVAMKEIRAKYYESHREEILFKAKLGAMLMRMARKNEKKYGRERCA